MEGDLVLKEEKVYVSKNKTLRVVIIWLYYDIPVAEHRGKWKTIELLTRNYWWLRVIRDMEKYIEGCNMC